MCECTCGKPQLKVGDTLYGFAGGEFGSSSYGPRLVVHIGPDFVVYREEGSNHIWNGNPSDLVVYTEEEPEVY